LELAIWLALAVAVTVLLVSLPRYLVNAEAILAGIALIYLALFVYFVMRKPRPRSERQDRLGIVAKLSEVTRALSAGVCDVGRSRFLYEAFWVFSLILLFQALAFWLLMRAYGLDFSLWHGVAVLLIVHLGTSIASAPSNLGTYQFLTVIMLVQFGVEKTKATGFSMVIFVILTIPLRVIGLSAFGRAGIPLRQVRTDIYRLAKH